MPTETTWTDYLQVDQLTSPRVNSLDLLLEVSCWIPSQLAGAQEGKKVRNPITLAKLDTWWWITLALTTTRRQTLSQKIHIPPAAWSKRKKKQEFRGLGALKAESDQIDLGRTKSRRLGPNYRNQAKANRWKIRQFVRSPNWGEIPKSEIFLFVLEY